MNKLAASFGLIALGASCFQASAEEPYISGDPGKIWSVSASLRGFYDDNRNTTSGSAKQEAFGYSVEPAIHLNWERDQNTLILGYKYALIYYDRTTSGFEKYNHNHFANLEFDHVFSERFQVKATDAFSVAQEPYLLQSGGILPTISSLSGNNYLNQAGLVFNGELTPLIGIEAGYRNVLADYESPALSALLDRMEQAFHVDGRWNVLPETVAVLGYQYSMVDYTRRYLIPPTYLLTSDTKNNRSHYVYIGADQTFTPDLSGSVRVGGRMTDYYNDPTGSQTEFSPYARLGLNWTYAPESALSVGMSYDRNATDISSMFGGLVRDEESAAIFANLRHRIVPNLFGSVNLQYQHSTVNSTDASVDGQTEQIFLAGVNLQYVINRYLSADVGYDFDKVDSDLGRSYDRNRIYIGITGSY